MVLLLTSMKGIPIDASGAITVSSGRPTGPVIYGCGYDGAYCCCENTVPGGVCEGGTVCGNQGCAGGCVWNDCCWIGCGPDAGYCGDCGCGKPCCGCIGGEKGRCGVCAGWFTCG